jgi:ribosomal protein L7/L12
VVVLKWVHAEALCVRSRAAARRVFDNAPSLIMRNVDAETAAKAKSRLERAGATASFRPGPAPAAQPVPVPVQPVQPVPVQPAAPDPGPAFAGLGTAVGDLEGNPPGGAPAVTQELFDVVLESVGRRQIHVIKAIREASPTKVGLSEAKSLADNVPSLILRQVDQETAARAKSLLEAVGATITVRPGAR